MKNEKKKLFMYDFIQMAKADRAIWKFINETYCCSGRQAELLEKIMSGFGEEKRGEQIEMLREQIYLYGSMIKGRDFMARQMFLWLLSILETL